jgi:hypothetical protein
MRRRDCGFPKIHKSYIAEEAGTCAFVVIVISPRVIPESVQYAVVAMSFEVTAGTASMPIGEATHEDVMTYEEFRDSISRCELHRGPYMPS